MIPECKVTDLTLDDLKKYLRVEYSYDDEWLEVILASAKSFIQNRMKVKFEEFGDDLPQEFTIACLSLCSHWYKNKAIEKDANSKEISFIFSSIIDLHRDYL